MKSSEQTEHIAVVTGAGSGIGKATARLAAKQGAKVALLDIDQAAVEQAADEIGDNTVLPLKSDISDAQQLESALAQIKRQFGTPTAVCHCAAMQQFGRLEDISVEAFQKLISINLVGSYALSKLFIPELLKASGSLVHVASLAGSIGLPYDIAYSASKAGVITMVKSMAKEFADRDIRINAIAPGAVDTPMLHMAPPDNINPDVLGVIPRSAKKPAAAEEVARLALYLMFDAPPSMTGSIVSIDGAAN